MSRQFNKNTQSERKAEDQKRDAASNPARDSRNDKEARFPHDRRNNDLSNISGLDPYRLNDLYERSSF